MYKLLLAIFIQINRIWKTYRNFFTKKKNIFNLTWAKYFDTGYMHCMLAMLKQYKTTMTTFLPLCWVSEFVITYNKNNSYSFLPEQWGRCLVWRFAPYPRPIGAWPPTCTARCWHSPPWSFGRTNRTPRHWSEAPPPRTHCTSQTHCVVLFVFHPYWTQMRLDLSAKNTNLRLSTQTQTHKNKMCKLFVQYTWKRH